MSKEASHQEFRGLKHDCKTDPNVIQFDKIGGKKMIQNGSSHNKSSLIPVQLSNLAIIYHRLD